MNRVGSLINQLHLKISAALFSFLTGNRVAQRWKIISNDFSNLAKNSYVSNLIDIKENIWKLTPRCCLILQNENYRGRIGNVTYLFVFLRTRPFCLQLSFYIHYSGLNLNSSFLKGNQDNLKYPKILFS